MSNDREDCLRLIRVLVLALLAAACIRADTAAAILQVGIDGVMVPQEGQHCDPRGRAPKGDPEPPRHERKLPALPASPRDGDGIEGVAWHEASVATVAFYDVQGKHLSTTYL